MAKRAIPPFLVPMLGMLALVAAFLVHSNKNGGLPFSLDRILGSITQKTAILPPKSESVKKAVRPDADLITTWQGRPVPEILGGLTPAANAPPTSLTFPEVEGVDPFRPRFLPIKTERATALPAFDDAALLDGTLVLSTDGQPLPLPGLTANSLGGRRLLPADFDGDGDTDLFIVRGAGLPSSLLRRGSGDRLEDITTAAGLLDFLDTIEAAWIDFDRDGRLDLFTVSNPATAGEASLLRLFRNVDGNRFTDISRDLRLMAKAPVKAFLWRDVDQDSFPDLLLSLDGEPGALQLLIAIPTAEINDWRLTDATIIFGLDQIRGGGPLALGDLDRDGNVELVAAAEGKVSVLMRNETAANFFPYVNVTESLDLSGIPSPSALLFEDFDNDGFLDLAVTGGTPEAPTSRAWWNRGGLRFREIPGAAGLITSARIQRLIRLDPDGDGICAVFLAAGKTHHGVRLEPAAEMLADNSRSVVQLSAGDSGANPNGFGARLSLVVRDENWTLSTIERVVDEIEEIIGLGPAKTIESITVTWPDRQHSQTLYGKLPVNHQLELGPDPGKVKTAPLPLPVGSPDATETETNS